MADGESKREAILKAKPHSKTWAKKVEKMKPGKVLSVYFQLKQSGKIR